MPETAALGEGAGAANKPVGVYPAGLVFSGFGAQSRLQMTHYGIVDRRQKAEGRGQNEKQQTVAARASLDRESNVHSKRGRGMQQRLARKAQRK